ncbi:MAG: SPOR domain-containing protein [Roseivivax sp.]|nr:SPOR domain-containing protein [Roseivivax sp.]
MTGAMPARAWIAAAALLVLAGCDSAKLPGFLQGKDRPADASAEAGTGGATTERDVEAPEVFEAREDGLWDGRPSLGGVWAAHPDVKEPERIIIRNEESGQFVIGALFRKERDTPGPRLQISSDAAAALGMLAGKPTKLSVVALRREEAPVIDPAAAAEPMPQPAEGALGAPSDVTAAPLDPVAATAEAALAEPAPAAAPTPSPQPAAAPAPAPAPVASDLAKPFIQIGIFSVEENAENTATAMRQRGLVPTVKKQSARGKTFWRVLVGPARSKSELTQLLKKIQEAGFTDAYAVTN